MISEAYFHNLATIRRAAADNHLCLMATRLQGTGERVAAVMAYTTEAGTVHVVPFGMLKGESLVSEGGTLTAQVKAQWKALLADLRDESKQAWFTEKDERVSVRFSVEGFPEGDAPYVFILPWDNPYEIFQDPTSPGDTVHG